MKKIDNILNKLITLGVSAMLLFSVAACDSNEGNYAYDDWDEDSNELLDDNEFTRLSSDYYYGDWDANDDNLIDENEWNEGWGSYMTGQEYDENWFNDWDINGDEALDDNEFSEGMFGYWDEDESGYIDENEYTNYYEL